MTVCLGFVLCENTNASCVRLASPCLVLCCVVYCLVVLCCCATLCHATSHHLVCQPSKEADSGRTSQPASQPNSQSYKRQQLQNSVSVWCDGIVSNLDASATCHWMGHVEWNTPVLPVPANNGRNAPTWCRHACEPNQVASVACGIV